MAIARLVRDFLHRMRGGSRGSADAADAMRRADEREAAGDRDGALRLLEAAIAAGVRDAGLHARAGALSGQLGRIGRARELLEAALAVAPGHVGALADLALAWRLERRLDEAVRCLRRAHALAPDNPHVRSNLAHCLREAGDLRGAFDLYAAALRVEPLDEEALRGLSALIGALEPGEAIAGIVRDIAAAHPGHALAHATLGYYQLKHEFDPAGAMAHFDRALALGRRDLDTVANRAIALQDLGRINEALRAYDEALAIDPRSAHVRFHRALALLLDGRFGEAWDDYELRLLQADQPRKMPQVPAWDGTAAPGRTLLVCAEQGLGDEIMFASCLPEAIARSGRCVVDCSPRLAAMFLRSFPGIEVHAVEQRAAPQWERFTPIDLAIRAGSLPRLFRRSLQAFPQHPGYLRADPARVERMRARLAALGPGRAIGLSWRGGTRRSRAPLRSLTLERLLPLLRIPGIHWVSLQYDAGAGEVDAFARQHGIDLVHWQDAIDDYEDTAALACALELTISVCTAIVHLCGALGRPVRVMAPYSPEWRYGARGERMPWYPSARVIRQRSPGDWDGVLQEIGRELGSAGGRATGG